MSEQTRKEYEAADRVLARQMVAQTEREAYDLARCVISTRVDRLEATISYLLDVVEVGTQTIDAIKALIDVAHRRNRAVPWSRILDVIALYQPKPSIQDALKERSGK